MCSLQIVITSISGREFAGALLRPHSPALRPLMKMGMPVDDVFEAAKETGRQLVRNGEMLNLIGLLNCVYIKACGENGT